MSEESLSTIIIGIIIVHFSNKDFTDIQWHYYKVFLLIFCTIMECAALAVADANFCRGEGFATYTLARTEVAIICILGICFAQRYPQNARILLAPYAIKMVYDFTSLLYACSCICGMLIENVSTEEIVEWARWYLPMDAEDCIRSRGWCRNMSLEERLNDDVLMATIAFSILCIQKTAQAYVLKGCWIHLKKTCEEARRAELPYVNIQNCKECR